MKSRFKLLLFISMLVSFTGTLSAQTRTASVSGNWNSTATWGGQSVPTAVNDVIINNGINVTVTASASAASISFVAGTTSCTLTVNSSMLLDVSGAITVNTLQGGNVNRVIAGAGTINCGSVDIGGTTNINPNGTRTVVLNSTITNFNVTGDIVFRGWRWNSAIRVSVPTLNLNSGTLNLDGEVLAIHEDADNSCNFNLGNTSPTLLLAAAVPFPAPALGTFNKSFAGTGATVNYDGAVDQTVLGTAYRNLILSNSNTKTLSAAATVNGALTVAAGVALDLSTFSLGSPTSITLSGGATAASSISGTGTLTLGGNITVNDATTGIAGATISCPVALGATRNFTVADDGSTAADLTVSSVISGATFGIIKLGTGTMVLSGNSSYSGATTVSAGILRASVNNVVALTNGPFGNAASSLNLNGGTIQSDVSTFSRPITIQATNSTIDAFGSARAISSPINLNTAGTMDLILGGTTVLNEEGQSLTLSGTISNTLGTLRLIKTGTSTVTISTATNSYSGSTTINGGVLSIDADARLGTAPASPTSGHLTINSGTLAITSSFTLNTNRSITIGVSDAFIDVASGQTLTFAGSVTGGNDLTKSSAGGLAFGAGNITLGNLTVNEGTFTAPSGTLFISGSFINNGTFVHNSGTVNYNNATGGQAVAGLTYRNLTLSNTSGTNTAGGAIDCFNFVMSNAGATLDMVTYDLNIGGAISLSGTLKTQSQSATPLPSGTVWGGTVEYNHESGGQKIVAGTYTNLKSSSTSGTNTATGALTVNGQLTVATGGILDMVTFALGGTITGTFGSGKIQTQCSTASPLPLPAGATWSPAVEYNRTGTQTIAAGTYSTLITSISGTKTLGGNTTVTTALTLNAGTLAVSTRTLTIQTTTVTNTTGLISMSVSGTLTFDFAGTLSFASAIFSGGLGTVNINGGGRVNLPSTPGSPQSVININLNSGKLGLGANSILAIGGAVTNMSATDCLVSDGTGSIEIVGPGALGTLFFDQTTPGTTNTISNFTINRSNLAGTLTIGNTIRVKTQLTPTAGTVTSNGNLVIGSDANGTGKIYPAINAANFAFVGDVKVERYAKDKNMRRFLFLSSPVDNISIRNAWQDDIFITGAGTGGTPCGATSGNGGATDKYNSNGFDATILNTVSVYRYDQNTTARWVAVPNTSYALEKGKGYRVLYRGFRGLNDANCGDYLQSNTPPTPSEATMNVAGTLIAGSFTVDVDGPTTGTYGYTLLGNPYACELDFDQFAAQNNTQIAPAYWTFDPNGTTSNTAYISYSTTLGGEVAGTYHSDPSGDPQLYPNPELIGSGQAFFVQASVDGQVTFSETQKSNQVQQGLFKTQSLTSKIRIHFKQSDGTPVDNIVVRFSDHPEVTIAENVKFDAITFNSGNFLASIKGTRSFAIQTRPLNFLNDTVQLRVVSSSTGNFKLEFAQFTDFTQAAEIILIDQFMGTQTNVKANPVYPFTITSNAASQAGRFKIVFRSMTAVLPLSYINISATQKTQGVEVAWQVAYEQGVSKYQVEKSDNGMSFSAIGFVESKGNSNSAVDYSFVDKGNIQGTVYYRIKSIENGPGRYSAIVKINSTNQQPSLSLYPNPAKDRLTIHNGSQQEKATITISNAQGRIVLQLANVNVNNYSVDVSAFAPGLYIIRLTNQDGLNLSEKFIKY